VHVSFLGLGQIGGSIARAASSAGFATRVTAWTPAGAGPRAATTDGIEASPTAADTIRGADLIVLAAPPLACLGLLDALAGPLAADIDPDAVITDVASTKAAIVERARARGLRIVGGHPMAGRETAGYGGADADLFLDRPWVLVPPDPADADALERVSSMVSAVGARPVLMNADEHDRTVALISHLPLLLSSALVETAARSPDWPAVLALAAGGWDGMTRLARGDVRMGSGIFATNAVEVERVLAALRETLAGWEADLRESDVDGRTGARLADARTTLTGQDS
jgi:prephenate dehydrogenase